MASSRINLLAALAALVATGSAASAADLTADQIVAALRPNAAALNGGATRGIRAMGSPAPASRAVPIAASQHLAASTAPTGLDVDIKFKTGSAELSPASQNQLNQLGTALSSNAMANDKIRIEGHTDTAGIAEANRTLSQQRADAVAEYLKAKFGVQPDRLQAAGMGEDGLLVKTPDQTPEPRNRRVRIVDLSA